jgi:hypothetical protein
LGFLQETLSLAFRLGNYLLHPNFRRLYDLGFTHAAFDVLVRPSEAKRYLFVGLGEDFFPSGEDVARFADFFRDGGAELVDDVEQASAVDHDAGADRQATGLADDLFKPVNEM